jgi:hypothetical protein
LTTFLTTSISTRTYRLLRLVTNTYSFTSHSFVLL